MNEAEIEKDLEVITIPISNVIEYRKRMCLSVDQQLAYRVYKDGVSLAFMYNYKKDKKYFSASIYSNDKVAFILLLKTVFELNNSYCIFVNPHEGFVNKYKSFFSQTSLRRWYTAKQPIPIYKTRLWAIGEKLFYYLGIEHV